MGLCTGYDLTIPCTVIDHPNKIKELLLEWASKWVFQKEKANEYEHFQVRLRLWKKKTLEQVLHQIAPHFPGHWSVTSGEVHRSNNFNYVMKGDTRVDGPWTDKEYTPPPRWSRQMEEMEPLKPWQESLKIIAQEWDMRYINVIWDPTGHHGKSIFAEHMEYHGLALDLPMLKDIESLIQFCFNFPDQKCYMFDMPKAMKKTNLAEFYAGVEILKNGKVWDKRYKGAMRRMDRPQIIIFSNLLPRMDLLSPQRWKIWTITPELELNLHMTS